MMLAVDLFRSKASLIMGNRKRRIKWYVSNTTFAFAGRAHVQLMSNV
jgi:hypothetical protein